MNTIAIIGLGYVGLPLALQFTRTGSRVLGLDIDPAKIERLSAGQSYIRHVPAKTVEAARTAGLLEASGDFTRIREAEAVILCVPTPLRAEREPDLSYVLNTARQIAPHLQRGQLVVLESTTYPGTTEGELRAVLEAGSGLKAGADFHLAYSPEREDPGNPDNQLANIPKIIGGYTPACLVKAQAVYGRAIQTLVPVSSCRVAEAAKLLENIFRSVNIALVNELKVVYGAMDIDIWEVIAAAKTKPFGFMPFYPGPGLGGHCIPIDPFYLAWKARQFGQHTRFIELAGEINTAMPEHALQVALHALASNGKSAHGARVLILGLAYKANVDDDRESPSYKLIQKFEALGAVVAYHDPFIPVIPKTREHAGYADRRSVPTVTPDYDLLVLATGHDVYREFDFTNFPMPLVDTRNAVPAPRRPKKYFKA